ncbi:hypothetical protein KR018_002350, partial [Drosophila ironensis]
QQFPRIVTANPGEKSDVWSRSLCVNAWTQTTNEDFELLRTLTPVDPNLAAENRALHEKVRYLEAQLQQRMDIISHIHATAGSMHPAGHVPPTPTPPAVPSHQILTPPSSVICAPVQSSQQAQVVDYKIIAADDTDAIEIRLAAESLNSLSSSGDSDRLEICLGDENHSQTLNEDLAKPVHVIKRRKLQEIQVPLEANKDSARKHKKLPLTPLGSAKVRNGSLNDLASSPMDKVMVSIGPNNTCVPASVFENINWSASSLATRKLLVSIFDRETLATHSMTGKPSPAFKDQHKPLKQMLDPLKIQDIIFAVTHKCNATEKEVRNAITTKCADENKMMKIQSIKRRSSGIKPEKENMI